MKTSFLKALGKAATRRHGNLVWDGVVRGSGLLGLAAIPAVLWFPDAGPLVGFVLVTIWVNGPIAPLLPATYEPILMLYGRLYPPIVVGLLGISGTIYVEHLNYHLYRKVLDSSLLTRPRGSRWLDWVVRRFNRSPFFTIWLCSWSPLPYWAVRFLSPLARYPVGKHLWATFLGRFPRLVFFAALGTWWQVEIGWLLWITGASVALAAAVWWYRGREARNRTAAVISLEA
jgi:uncharacterized membrane protein YdjX (TVP38/TMEM64 family)